jgi:hypothetical protein
MMILRALPDDNAILLLPRRLTLTSAFPADEENEGKHSRVTFDLEPLGDEVRLTLTHDGLEPGSEMRSDIA